MLGRLITRQPEPSPPALPSAIEKTLIAEAKAASKRAYCPYSQFRVGAAVLGTDGRVVSGCNVENASYGLTLCAERVATVRAIAEGSTQLKALVVYTPTSEPTLPCGACRQVLFEFGPELLVICVGQGDRAIRRTLAELLPDAFGPRDLQQAVPNGPNTTGSD